MILNDEEKQIMINALRVYGQIAKQQMTPDVYATVVVKVGSLSKKIKEDGTPIVDVCPPGLTEEQWTSVCKLLCDKFIDGKCTDPIAKKYPGKCDPILKFERQKTLDVKKLETEKKEE
jgi:hypothetical protein